MLDYLKYRLKWHLAPYILPKYPLHVDIELSAACNLKCGFCPHSEETTAFKKDFMPYENFKKLIDEIEGKVPSIKLNLRGESTLHPDFIRCLWYVKNKFIDIRLNTNGQYRQHLNQVISLICTKISFSVDADNAHTYNRIRKGGSWTKLINNIRLIYKNNPKANVELSFVVTPLNEMQVNSFKDGFKNMFPNVKFFIRPAMERTKTKLAILNKENAIKRKDCLMPRRRLAIAHDGNIYPCCLMWRDTISLGRMPISGIDVVWKGSAISFLRKQLAKKKFYNGCGTPNACIECDSRESYVWRKG